PLACESIAKEAVGQDEVSVQGNGLLECADGLVQIFPCKYSATIKMGKGQAGIQPCGDVKLGKGGVCLADGAKDIALVIVGLREVRTDAQGCVVGCDGLVVLPFGAVYVTKIVVGFSEIRIDAQGCVVGCNGLVLFPFGAVYVPKIVVGISELRAE